MINSKEQIKLLLKEVQFLVGYFYLLVQMTEQLPKKIIYKLFCILGLIFKFWSAFCHLSLFKQEYQKNFSLKVALYWKWFYFK